MFEGRNQILPRLQFTQQGVIRLSANASLKEPDWEDWAIHWDFHGNTPAGRICRASWRRPSEQSMVVVAMFPCVMSLHLIGPLVL